MLDIFKPGEKVLSIQRRHWFWLFTSLFPIGVLALAVLFAPLLARIFLPDWYASFTSLIWFGMVLGLELVWLAFFYVIADYYLDYWIITDRRLVLIEVQGMFYRTVESVDFDAVQDIATKVAGVLPTLLNFGDVIVQSAGTYGRFVFPHVPRPDAARNLMLDVREAWLKRYRSGSAG